MGITSWRFRALSLLNIEMLLARTEARMCECGKRSDSDTWMVTMAFVASTELCTFSWGPVHFFSFIGNESTGICGITEPVGNASKAHRGYTHNW